MQKCSVHISEIFFFFFLFVCYCKIFLSTCLSFSSLFPPLSAFLLRLWWTPVWKALQVWLLTGSHTSSTGLMQVLAQCRALNSKPPDINSIHTLNLYSYPISPWRIRASLVWNAAFHSNVVNGRFRWSGVCVSIRYRSHWSVQHGRQHAHGAHLGESGSTSRYCGGSYRRVRALNCVF